MAEITALSDALTAALNGHQFSMSFVAARGYRAVAALDTIAGLHVTIIPRAAGAQRATRADQRVDYQVDIVVQDKAQTNAALDDLMSLVEEITDFLRNRDLLTDAAVWLGTSNVPLFAAADLADHDVFTSTLTTTYRMVR